MALTLENYKDMLESAIKTRDDLNDTIKALKLIIECKEVDKEPDSGF